MDITGIPWSEISLGTAIVIALIVMIKAQAKSTESLVKRFGETNSLIAQQLSETREDYKSYVQGNNHTMTQLVKESTSAIVTHTEVLKGISERLDRK